MLLQQMALIARNMCCGSMGPILFFLIFKCLVKMDFDLLRELDEPDFEVIFVTAYNEFAINAMKFSAVDYLLKPVDVAELQSAILRAGKRLKLKTHTG